MEALIKSSAEDVSELEEDSDVSYEHLEKEALEIINETNEKNSSLKDDALSDDKIDHRSGDLKQPSYDELVSTHTVLVKRIARRLSIKMPASVQIDDLIQAGMVGLLEAARKYDIKKGASFETFSGIRIRGAMLDEIRRGDWGPRSVYRKSRHINEVTRSLEAKLGRYAKHSEIAEEMGITFKEYADIMKDLKGCRLFSFEDLVCTVESKGVHANNLGHPDDSLVQEKFKTALVEAIATLPEREQLVLRLYYEQELNLKKIGAQLGVSESRVSQIHSQATARLKVKLSLWHDKLE